MGACRGATGRYSAERESRYRHAADGIRKIHANKGASHRESTSLRTPPEEHTVERESRCQEDTLMRTGRIGKQTAHREIAQENTPLTTRRKNNAAGGRAADTSLIVESPPKREHAIRKQAAAHTPRPLMAQTNER